MRKLFICFLLSILLGCGRDDEKIIISDFKESQIIILKPYKNYPYTMMNIWIKGHVNDTILIKLNSKTSKPILRLTGDINERWYTDYYGEGEKIIIFEPYRASEGNLEIKVSL
jgi:hypothetical protein